MTKYIGNTQMVYFRVPTPLKIELDKYATERNITISTAGSELLQKALYQIPIDCLERLEAAIRKACEECRGLDDSQLKK